MSARAAPGPLYLVVWASGVSVLNSRLSAPAPCLPSGYPTFVGLRWGGCRLRVVEQGGSWPLLPVVPRTTNFFPRERNFSFYCVRLVSCPAGSERPLGPGVEPSPPARLRV